MLGALPRRSLFQFEIPIRRREWLPVVDADMSKWSAEYLLPPLVRVEDSWPFADVYWAWDQEGLMLAFDVPDRHGPLRCDRNEWWKGDGVRICVDTRDTRDVKRATRFCHFFYALPTGGGPRRDRPVVGTRPMSRAKEPAPAVDVSAIRVAARVERRRYSLELAIPATCLHGWNPAEHQRIGVFYKIKDTGCGAQHLSVDDELGWNVDPSTWATGVLVR